MGTWYSEHSACVPPLLQSGQELFGVRTKGNSICTSKCTAAQPSNSPLAAAQCNPDPGFQEDTESNPTPLPMGWESPPHPALLLQGVRSQCTYLQGETWILCNPEPKQHKLGGSLQYTSFNASLPALKINVTTNNLLRMHLVLLILQLAGAGILRKSLRVNITYKETQLARLLFNRLNEQQTFWLTVFQR